MPRRPRLHLPGIPAHIVQRGNNRSTCFRDDHDRRDFLAILADRSSQHEVAIHAYVLMGNHFHLLASSLEAEAIPRCMQRVCAAYARHFNDRYERTGTLWEGRYRSHLIDSGSYLWSCHRYIELNPVRAGMVGSPGEYPWSSFAANALGGRNHLVTPCVQYLALGETAKARSEAYRSIFGSGADVSAGDEIRRHLFHERPWGDLAFLHAIEARTGLSVAIKPCGRPRSTTDEQERIASDPIFRRGPCAVRR